MKTLEEVLEHHGIKGMHWGVRRSRGADGHVTGSSKPSSGHESSEDSKKAEDSHARVKAAGGTHVLSNQELQHVVNRMNLEQQFTKTTTQSKSKPGAKFAKELIVNVGKQQVTKLASDAAAKAIASALKK